VCVCLCVCVSECNLMQQTPSAPKASRQVEVKTDAFLTTNKQSLCMLTAVVGIRFVVAINILLHFLTLLNNCDNETVVLYIS